MFDWQQKRGLLKETPVGLGNILIFLRGFEKSFSANFLTIASDCSFYPQAQGQEVWLQLKPLPSAKQEEGKYWRIWLPDKTITESAQSDSWQTKGTVSPDWICLEALLFNRPWWENEILTLKILLKLSLIFYGLLNFLNNPH